MGDRSETSMSDATINTDCSSLHSNDDTQSSIDSIVIDLSHIPDTPNIRKSVTFFSDKEPSSFLSGKIPLAATYEPSEGGGTYDEQKMVDVAGFGSRTVSDMEGGGDLNPLIGHRPSINHRASVVSYSDVIMTRPRNSHYMKVWAITLLVVISLFACGLFFWPLSTAPPLLPLIQKQVFPPINVPSDPTIHVNRTTRDMRITFQEIRNSDFVSMRYTQSYSFLSNETWPLEFNQAKKCSQHIDSDVICCRIMMDYRECYIKDGQDGIRNYTVANSQEVMDIETFQGRVHILKLDRRRDEFFLYNGKNEGFLSKGKSERRLRIPVPPGYELTKAFLQNGTIFSVVEDRISCEQMICQEKHCLPVRKPQCGLMRVFPALPSNSLVFMHCDGEDLREGLHKQSLCTLSQLILPSLATIAKSAPFKFTKGYNEDSHFVGFADYVDTSVFHVNQLRLGEQPLWETVVSTYRLLSLT